jgi:predicted transcriptional regulator
MDVSTIGFVKADRYRLRILEALKSRSTPQRISHRLRINMHIVEKSLEELRERGLIKQEEGEYQITKDGLKLLNQISAGRR